MKNLLSITGTVAIVALLLGTSLVQAEQNRYRSDQRQKHHSFAISGMYSGSLDGEVMISGRRVLVDNRTILHSTEDGRLEFGTHVVRRSVYVAGVIDRYGQKRATMIIVRDNNRSHGKRPVTVVGPDEGS